MVGIDIDLLWRVRLFVYCGLMDVRKWEGYGVMKMALAVICTVVAGAFVYFILYPFVDLFSNVCDTVAPFLGCKHAGEFASYVFGALGLLFWPFVGFPWLIRQSHLFVASSIIIIVLLMFFGGWILKRSYDLNNLDYAE